MFTFIFFAVLSGGHILQGTTTISTEKLCNQDQELFVKKFSVINPITGMPLSDNIQTMCLPSEPPQ